MTYNNYGYVIRCVELSTTGNVYYRGSGRTYANKKDAIPPSQTYTISGAKRAVANLQRMYPQEGQIQYG